MREKGIVSASAREEERQFEVSLRPSRLDDFAGQAKVKENLKIAIEAARRRGEAMDHVLLYGPPGTGQDYARQHHRAGTRSGIAADLRSRSAEEARSGRHSQQHRRPRGLLCRRNTPAPADVEEMIYSALEDFRMDILIGTGPGARTVSHGHSALHRHWRHHAAGLISAPLARPLRTGAPPESLRCSGTHSHRRKIGAIVEPGQIDRAGAEEIARRSRGTPRIANRCSGVCAITRKCAPADT
jgi:holliday junction DNA helicase RuvB